MNLSMKMGVFRLSSIESPAKLIASNTLQCESYQNNTTQLMINVSHSTLKLHVRCISLVFSVANCR